MVNFVGGVALHDGHAAARHAHCEVLLLRSHPNFLDAEIENLLGEELERNDGSCEKVRRVEMTVEPAAALVVYVRIAGFAHPFSRSPLLTRGDARHGPSGQ